jgi:hypothetical protein
MRPRVRVPTHDTNTWNEDSCAAAFQTLAEAPSFEHYREFSPGLDFIDLTRDEFVRWLVNNGYELPNFWKPPSSSKALDTSEQPPEDRNAPSSGAIGPAAGRTGRKKPIKLNKASKAMKTDLQQGNITKHELDNMLEKELLARYGAPFGITSRETVRSARKAIQSECDANSNTDK